VSRALVIVAFLAGGCLSKMSEPTVIGTRDDVRTTAGSYGGFRVVLACPQPWVDLGVIGTGAQKPAKVEDISAAGQELHQRLEDVASIWGYGGYGLECESGVGTSIDLSSWLDVDTVIERTGDWLRERDLDLQVGITVAEIPRPVAD
jgi:hypothetical protein